MAIEDLKRWHWAGLGVALGLGIAYVVVGIGVDALLVRPLLVPCGQWLLNRRSESKRMAQLLAPRPELVSQLSN